MASINNIFYHLIVKRRTIRKFKQKKISSAILRKIVNCARLAPSAANFQFLEYLVVTDKRLREKIFPLTKWAGYLKGKAAPSLNFRPPAYIVILINQKRSSRPDLRDVGAAAENILLSAWSFGIASCWIASLEKGKLRKLLRIPPFYQIDSLIALGYPAGRSFAVQDKKKIKYWQDKAGNFFVPKRPLKNILFYNELKR